MIKRKKRAGGWPLGSLEKGERLGCLSPVSVQREGLKKGIGKFGERGEKTKKRRLRRGFFFFPGDVWTIKKGLGREFSEERVGVRASRYFFLGP